MILLHRTGPTLLFGLLAVALSACGGEAKTVTATKTVTVESEGGEAGTGAVDPSRSSDDTTVAQVVTEATSKPWLEPRNYSPDSWAVNLHYDTRSGFSGLGCSAQDDQLVCSSSIGDEPTKVLYLKPTGSVEGGGATFAWKLDTAKGKREPVITVNGTTARGSQFGENLDEKRIEDVAVSVKQVILIAQALEDAAVEVA